MMFTLGIYFLIFNTCPGSHHCYQLFIYCLFQFQTLYLFFKFFPFITTANNSFFIDKYTFYFLLTYSLDNIFYSSSSSFSPSIIFFFFLPTFFYFPSLPTPFIFFFLPKFSKYLDPYLHSYPLQASSTIPFLPTFFQ